MMLRRTAALFCVLFLIALPVRAQDTIDASAIDTASVSTAADMETFVPPTPAEERMASYQQRQALLNQSLVAEVPFENIGPTIMSGRVVDLDVNPDDPTHFYVAYASGGLWQTTNNGRSFTPLFDHQASMTLGDIAVDWDNNVVWAGTGENNSSRSSYAGTGLYKSSDGGQTWQHMGLADIHRTGRIILHPSDTSTVWVAAAGHLYSPNSERGVYKSTDGGQTWTKTLFVNDETGAIDLTMDPNDPNVLYAATWERARRAWNFVEAGEGSGIYKSTDGGSSWTELSTEDSGFPTGANIGRIGLAVYPGDSNIVYAFVDNQNRRPEEEEDEDEPALTKDMIRDMSRSEFLDVSRDALKEYLSGNDFPASYTAESVLDLVRSGKIEPVALVDYLEDANAQLFDTPVVGAEVYRSNDGGATWARTHEDYLDDVYYSYGYYFGEIRVAPQDADAIYIMGVPMLKSKDGGATFSPVRAGNLHVDHHALWLNPNRPGHLVAGNDGGVNVSYDDGDTWFKFNTPPVGQFYAVQVDDAEPYNVYGGLQDNGGWGGPHTYEADYEWYAEGDYPYNRIMGGDGMQVEVDTRTNNTVYTGFQFGNYYRVDKETGATTAIKPEHELGERPLRFNWQTPIHLSRHNQDILYFGSNKFHRSLDQGETWDTLSDDLTGGDYPGDVPYGTLTSIDESPLKFGLIYVGTDDGRIHVSRDGGTSWTRIDGSLPQNLWVSRVEASHHDRGRVYATLNGYRWDHFDAYVYRSDDYGQTWSRLGTDLPKEPVNVVVEDPANPDVLYVGTDHGLYASLDRGETFMAMGGGMPHAPVHDLKVQARAKDLVVGTHGRSIFRADIAHVQALTPEVIQEPLYAFSPDSLQYSDGWGEVEAVWAEVDTPSVHIPFYSSEAGPVEVRIQAEGGETLRTWSAEATRGLNYLPYDLTVDADGAERYNQRVERETEDDEEPALLEAADNDETYLRPGTYTVLIERGGATVQTTLRVLDGAEGEPAEPVPGPEGDEEIK